MFYKENKMLVNKQEVSIIQNNILSVNFPWFYHQISTTQEYPVYTHTLIHRYDIKNEQPIINSEVFPVFENIVLRFCEKEKINFKKFTRAVINSISFNRFEKVDAHIDHDFKHKVLMIYLNATDGDTIIYDKKFNGKDRIISSRNLNILKTIKPEMYKVVCWDGDYYHAATYPKTNNRRVVFVATFI
jgi:hypothetical protein